MKIYRKNIYGFLNCKRLFRPGKKLKECDCILILLPWYLIEDPAIGFI